MVQYGYGLYVELRFLRRIHLSYQYETNHGVVPKRRECNRCRSYEPSENDDHSGSYLYSRYHSYLPSNATGTKEEERARPGKSPHDWYGKGHYLSFIKATRDEMDQYPHMKCHHRSWIMPLFIPPRMSVHISFQEAIASSTCHHTLPELNQIEQFWSIVKSKVNRSQFSDETLTKDRRDL